MQRGVRVGPEFQNTMIFNDLGDTDGGPKRIFACSGLWGLVESEDGVRGWWRSLCSNQVTNCS